MVSGSQREEHPVLAGKAWQGEWVWLWRQESEAADQITCAVEK